MPVSFFEGEVAGGRELWASKGFCLLFVCFTLICLGRGCLEGTSPHLILLPFWVYFSRIFSLHFSSPKGALKIEGGDAPPHLIQFMPVSWCLYSRRILVVCM